ncbi:hypothetical protein GF354_03105 [Candidatus Peregrinibacteria bacterium]|nr:hypothetical protein [Candidatus Peregrinibacteria bacterium]
MPSLWKITTLGLIIIFSIIVWIFVIGISADQPGSYYNSGHNAVWVGHEWVGEQKSDGEIQQFVRTLEDNRINTVFVHCGPFNNDGTVHHATYRYAFKFLESARKFNENIEYQAWLGQIRSEIDLEDELIQDNIVRQTKIFTDLAGFDGIHFDIEPVWDEDLAFIEVLRKTDEGLKDDKKISVALAEFIPSVFLWMTENIHEYRNYNTEVNYRNVAKYADQIVVMVYDTGINSKNLYEWIVKEQTIRVTSLFDDIEVFIGIPAYEDEKEGFDPGIENIETGLNGVIAGLNNIRSNEKSFSGVSIYPYWEISEKEWEIYSNLWLK